MQLEVLAEQTNLLQSAEMQREKVIKHINQKDWWHVPPADSQAYEKRGRFLSSSFKDAEFYGRPLDEPQHVHISNPVIGDEKTVERVLLGATVARATIQIEARLDLDRRLKEAAVGKGYDSIVLMSEKAYKEFLQTGKIPRSIELNVFSARPPQEINVNLLSGVSGKYGSILIDPPWRFANRTGKVGPEHKRLRRYSTLSFEEIANLPIPDLGLPKSHLYLWCPNALLLEALTIMKRWGYVYKTNIVWYKTRKDGGPDGRGVGFYFRNVTELLLFGTKGKIRTLQPGRRQVNILISRKQEHSRKPDETYDLIQRCSPGPYLELFGRQRVPGWTQWGDEIDSYVSQRRLYAPYNGWALAAS